MKDTGAQLASLVPLAADGDKRALKELTRLIYPQVLRYCRARIGGGKSPTAEDVTQEVCLAVVGALPGYVDTGRPFMAFVYGIAFNKVTDAHRSFGRDLSHPTEVMPETADDAATPEEAALNQDGSNRMRALLDTLNDTAREVIVLRVYGGLSAEETAEIIGSTPGAVRVTQHRALAQLRKLLAHDSQTGGLR